MREQPEEPDLRNTVCLSSEMWAVRQPAQTAAVIQKEANLLHKLRPRPSEHHGGNASCADSLQGISVQGSTKGPLCEIYLIYEFCAVILFNSNVISKPQIQA